MKTPCSNFVRVAAIMAIVAPASYEFYIYDTDNDGSESTALSSRVL